MPQTIPRNEELERRAQELYVPGVFGYKRVARELGLTDGTARRYVIPGARERDRQFSRAAKARRTSSCEICGTPTRYNGRTGVGSSKRCIRCAQKESAEARRGTGPVQCHLIAALSKHGEMTFTQIHEELGITKNHAGPLLDRARKLGLVVRVRRGVYALPKNEEG